MMKITALIFFGFAPSVLAMFSNTNPGVANASERDSLVEKASQKITMEVKLTIAEAQQLKSFLEPLSDEAVVFSAEETHDNVNFKLTPSHKLVGKPQKRGCWACIKGALASLFGFTSPATEFHPFPNWQGVETQLKEQSLRQELRTKNVLPHQFRKECIAFGPKSGGDRTILISLNEKITIIAVRHGESLWNQRKNAETFELPTDSRCELDGQQTTILFPESDDKIILDEHLKIVRVQLMEEDLSGHLLNRRVDGFSIDGDNFADIKDPADLVLALSQKKGGLIRLYKKNQNINDNNAYAFGTYTDAPLSREGRQQAKQLHEELMKPDNKGWLSNKESDGEWLQDQVRTGRVGFAMSNLKRAQATLKIGFRDFIPAPSIQDEHIPIKDRIQVMSDLQESEWGSDAGCSRTSAQMQAAFVLEDQGDEFRDDDGNIQYGRRFGYDFKHNHQWFAWARNWTSQSRARRSLETFFKLHTQFQQDIFVFSGHSHQIRHMMDEIVPRHLIIEENEWAFDDHLKKCGVWATKAKLENAGMMKFEVERRGDGSFRIVEDSWSQPEYSEESDNQHEPSQQSDEQHDDSEQEIIQRGRKMSVPRKASINRKDSMGGGLRGLQTGKMDKAKAERLWKKVQEDVLSAGTQKSTLLGHRSARSQFHSVSGAPELTRRASARTAHATAHATLR